MAFPADAREQRIRAKAHALWEVDGRPQGRDREHWEQAAKLVEGEERRAARAKVDLAAAQNDGASSPTNDPIGVTLGAMKRQN
jgi:hypothetical protein